jgi:hypothetical protein
MDNEKDIKNNDAQNSRSSKDESDDSQSSPLQKKNKED